uniref:Very-long-chain (3R)-3-hydroxyacyl-CoA dehydratase n=1 Tax=Nannospalax galili TaxID=1026970 RepID=A0A8C6RAD9_NANGA
MESQVLTPHVYWAQRHRELYLRVELSDVQNPAISITENVLHFKAQGHGAKGDNVYEFHLEFLDLVKPEPMYRLTQRQVNITVQKKVSQWWERLTKQEKRPLFLAPDFDRWLDESDAEMELRAKVSKHMRPLPLKGLIEWGIHVVKSAVISLPIPPPFFTFLGRNFILFIIFGTMEEMQNKAVVFFVFYSWSMIEIFRYPFYMLCCIDMDWKVLTWLRYTMWIPLYPLGCLAEAVSVIQSIPVFNETERFSFILPYPVKIKVRFSFFLQIYLIMLFLGLYINFRHLYKQRRRRYGQKKKKMH